MKRIVALILMISLVAKPIGIEKGKDVTKKPKIQSLEEQARRFQETLERVKLAQDEEQARRDQEKARIEEARTKYKTFRDKQLQILTQKKPLKDRITEALKEIDLRDLSIAPDDARIELVIEEYKKGLEDEKMSANELVEFLTPEGGFLRVALRSQSLADAMTSPKFLNRLTAEQKADFAEKLATMIEKLPASARGFSGYRDTLEAFIKSAEKAGSVDAKKITSLKIRATNIAVENIKAILEQTKYGNLIERATAEALVAYRRALEKAKAGDYEAPIVLELFTSEGNFLEIALKDQKIFAAIKDSAFLKKLSPENKIKFAQKVAKLQEKATQLTANGRTVFKEYMESAAKDTQDSSDAMNDPITKEDKTLADIIIDSFKSLRGSNIEDYLKPWQKMFDKEHTENPKFAAALKLEQIRDLLAQPNQTETRRTQAVKMYREALQQAQNGQYDRATVLAFLTPEGGLLQRVLADEASRKILLSENFLNRLNVKDGLQFAKVITKARNSDKYSSLTQEQRSDYETFLINWTNSLAQAPSLSEDQFGELLSFIKSIPGGERLSDGRLKVYQTLYAKLPEDKNKRTQFRDQYLEALQDTSVTVTALAQGIEFFKTKNLQASDAPTKKTLNNLKLRIISLGAVRPDFMEVFTPPTRALIINAMDDLLQTETPSNEKLDRTTISQVADSINTAIANVKAKLAKDPKNNALQANLENLLTTRDQLAQRISSKDWRENIQLSGKSIHPRFMRDFTRADEAELNKMLFGRSEARFQDITFTNANEVVDALAAISVYTKLYPKTNFPTEHSALIKQVNKALEPRLGLYKEQRQIRIDEVAKALIGQENSQELQDILIQALPPLKASELRLDLFERVKNSSDIQFMSPSAIENPGVLNAITTPKNLENMTNVQFEALTTWIKTQFNNKQSEVARSLNFFDQNINASKNKPSDKVIKRLTNLLAAYQDESIKFRKATEAYEMQNKDTIHENPDGDEAITLRGRRFEAENYDQQLKNIADKLISMQ